RLVSAVAHPVIRPAGKESDPVASDHDHRCGTSSAALAGALSADQNVAALSRISYCHPEPRRRRGTSQGARDVLTPNDSAERSMWQMAEAARHLRNPRRA